MSEITLKEKAYQELRKLILNGELKTGEFLTERALVEQLEMSRTPIRSALERLEAEGHVTYTPNRGIFVTEFSIDKVVDFYDFRMALESYVVNKLASKTLREEDIFWFQQNLDRQKKCLDSNDNAQFTTDDSEFHRKLAWTYGNMEIVQTMELLQDKLFRIALKVLRKENSRIQTSYEDHVRIFNLIMEGKSEEASQEMIQHLEFGKRILLF